jgi:hypothetical protein
MATAIHIEKQVAEETGRYVARVEGVDGEAELVFTIHSATLVSADHTEAAAGLRGTGAASALVEFMIGDARASGFKIRPICPYVLAQYQKHPEWHDVITISPAAS